MAGPTGEAWLVPVRTGPDVPPDLQGSVASYYVRAPGRHAFWEWWLMAVIHLRPIPGVRPALLHRPDASHEFMWAALDPGKCPPTGIDGEPQPGTVMTPLDLVHQVAGITDEQAGRILADCVRGVVGFGASPDSDLRQWWKTMLDGTVVHFLAGAHEVH